MDIFITFTHNFQFFFSQKKAVTVVNVFIFNGLLNMPLLSITLALNHMGMKNGFTEKIMNYSQLIAMC